MCVHIHGMHINVHTHQAEMWDMLTHILVARLKLLYKQMQGLLDVYTAFFSTDEDFNCLDLKPEKKKKKEWEVSKTWLDCNVLSKRGTFRNRFTYTCTHQIQTSLQTDGHCKQHYLHRIKLLHDVRLKCILYSRPLKSGDRIHMQTALIENRTVSYCVCFFFCLYVWFQFFFFEQWKYWKCVIVLFSKCWPPTVVSHALFLCCSLWNMCVTVAVIHVQLLAVWGYVAFLHVSYTHYMDTSMSETETKYVD